MRLLTAASLLLFLGGGPALAVDKFRAPLVQTIDTGAWNPNSPDPADIEYMPSTGTYFVCDSEIDEMPQYWQGVNVYEVTGAGVLLRTFTTIHFSAEPTGIALNRGNGHLYFSDDDKKRIFEVNLGADGILGTPDDVVTWIDTTVYGAPDAEGIAYGGGYVFLTGGVSHTVFVISPGPNGVLDGVAPAGDDYLVGKFDVLPMGLPDPEDVAYNTDTGTIFVVSHTQETDVIEATVSGTLLRVIDISAANAVRPGGLGYGPGMLNPRVNHLFVTDRGIDNNDPGGSDENDGKVYEMSLGDIPLPDLIFKDDFESGSLSQWSTLRTDNGDLSVAPAAALAGSYGMQALLDDQTSLWVGDNRPAAETRYRARFYFDPNSVAMHSGDNHFIFLGLGNNGSQVIRVEFRSYQGDYLIRAYLINNAGSWLSTPLVLLSDSVHIIEFDWRAATAPGALNGGLTLWVDGCLKGDITGVDNDTKVVKSARLGATSGVDPTTLGTYYFDSFESRRQTYIGPDPSAPPLPIPPIPPDAIFCDGFESGDFSAWSDLTGIGDLLVTPAAAMAGNYGLQLSISDNSPAYVTDWSPVAEKRYRARFYFNPNNITMAKNDAHSILQGVMGLSATVNEVVRLEIRYLTGYQIRAAITSDTGTLTNSNWFPLVNGRQTLEFDWQAATAPGALNGSLTLWIDGVQKAVISGIDNPTRVVDFVRLGAVSGIDTGTRGTYYFDGFASRRQTYIGP